MRIYAKNPYIVLNHTIVSKKLLTELPRPRATT